MVVGMIRFLEVLLIKTYKTLKHKDRGSFHFITGHSAYDEILKVATDKLLHRNNKIKY